MQWLATLGEHYITRKAYRKLCKVDSFTWYCCRCELQGNSTVNTYSVAELQPVAESKHIPAVLQHIAVFAIEEEQQEYTITEITDKAPLDVQEQDLMTASFNDNLQNKLTNEAISLSTSSEPVQQHYEESLPICTDLPHHVSLADEDLSFRILPMAFQHEGPILIHSQGYSNNKKPVD